LAEVESLLHAIEIESGGLDERAPFAISILGFLINRVGDKENWFFKPYFGTGHPATKDLKWLVG